MKRSDVFAKDALQEESEEEEEECAVPVVATGIVCARARGWVATEL